MKNGSYAEVDVVDLDVGLCTCDEEGETTVKTAVCLPTFAANKNNIVSSSNKSTVLKGYLLFGCNVDKGSVGGLCDREYMTVKVDGDTLGNSTESSGLGKLIILIEGYGCTCGSEGKRIKDRISIVGFITCSDSENAIIVLGEELSFSGADVCGVGNGEYYALVGASESKVTVAVVAGGGVGCKNLCIYDRSRGDTVSPLNDVVADNVITYSTACTDNDGALCRNVTVVFALDGIQISSP